MVRRIKFATGWRGNVQLPSAGIFHRDTFRAWASKALPYIYPSPSHLSLVVKFVSHLPWWLCKIISRALRIFCVCVKNKLCLSVGALQPPCERLNPNSAVHSSCDLGQVTQPPWTSVFSSGNKDVHSINFTGLSWELNQLIHGKHLKLTGTLQELSNCLNKQLAE